MTDKQIKVGDVVAWADVPDGALVRVRNNDFALRLGDLGHWVFLRGEIKMDWARVGAWGGWTYDDGEVVDEGPSTIVALGVRDHESPAELQRIAETFEILEALCLHELLTAVPVSGRWSSLRLELVAFAADLHRAGWRPGMTAEDAARLLAEAEAV